MKLETNFLFPWGRLFSWLLVAGWALSLLGLLTSAFLVWNALRDRGELGGLQAQLADLKSKPVAQPTGLPTQGDIEALRERLQNVNRLDIGGRPSPSLVLVRLEKDLPAKVELVNFQDERSTGAVELTLETMDVGEVSGTVSAFEGDSFFSKVALTKQNPGLNGAGVQFSVDMETP